MPIPITAPITDVTVYVNHARVTRRGNVTLEAGEHTLILSPITVLIEKDSIRAGGYGKGITIRSVDVKQDYQAKNPRKTVNDLHQQIDVVKQSITEVKDRASILENKLKWLEAFPQESGRLFAETIAKEESTFSKATETLNYLDTQESSIRSDIRDNLVKDKELQSQLSQLTQKLNDLL